MSDPIEEIRRQKRKELESELTDAGPDSGSDTPDEPVHIQDDDHLEDVTAEYRTVLADFYADWCGPCKQLEPIVEELAAETDAAIVKVDIDAHQRLARSYRVQGVPTMILFADGDPVERIVGVRSPDQLRTLIEQQT